MINQRAHWCTGYSLKIVTKKQKFERQSADAEKTEVKKRIRTRLKIKTTL